MSETTGAATIDVRTLPLDPTSAERLAAVGLDYRVLDPASTDFPSFAEAVDRGFLSSRATPEQVDSWREGMVERRATVVVDPGTTQPEVPVATVDSWVAQVTVDVNSTLPMWAISAVTVSATHRRRGIARSLLEGEIRTAAAAGIPLAGLTVSETTIYGRYGFAPALDVTSWTIDARRAGWVGPLPVAQGRGRIDPISRELAQAALGELHERTRLGTPGEVNATDRVWRGVVGLTPGHEAAAKIRAVSYRDGDGALRGVLVYVFEGGNDFTRHTLEVWSLKAETDDAYAALWHFALTHDLVGTVKAGERSTEEPLRWMVADTRALEITRRDHHWLRVIDVPACLQARRYRLPGAVVLRVSDPLGLAAGDWHVSIDDDGAATVERIGDGGDGGDGWVESDGVGSDGVQSADGTAVVELGVAELSALLLGGVRASHLAAAGRVQVADANDDGASDAGASRTAVLTWLDGTFAPAATPRLSRWY